jgi:hypothetical protein
MVEGEASEIAFVVLYLLEALRKIAVRRRQWGITKTTI